MKKMIALFFALSTLEITPAFSQDDRSAYAETERLFGADYIVGKLSELAKYKKLHELGAGCEATRKYVEVKDSISSDAEKGPSGPENIKQQQSVALLTSCARKGDVQSLRALASYIKEGYGTSKNPGKAVEIYEQIVSNPKTEPKMVTATAGMLLSVYKWGEKAGSQNGVSPNPVKFEKYFNIAVAGYTKEADAGDYQAVISLISFYRLKDEKDQVRGIEEKYADVLHRKR